MISIFESLDFFNSTYFYHHSEIELYNQIAHFLQHLQQRLHLYCESDLLDQLITILNDFVNKWFDDQSKFISLQNFDIVLTKIFSSSEFATIQSTKSSLQEQEKLKVSKKQKRVERQTLKNAKRVKSKALKAAEVAKSTSAIQDIDIFDSTLTCENRQFSELAKFLQHFQQCQHLYRESNLLMLLFTCLWNSVFDIWYDKQSIMNSASLCEWIEILRIDFAVVAFAKSKVNCSKIICMRCDSSFNFKKKFREHVREQHAKKLINSSFLSINTLKSMCKNEKKSLFDDSSVSLISQESEISTATSKQIFESTMIFETIIASKISHLSSNASETVSESMKNTSTQCSFISSKSLSSQTFESKHQEISVQKSSEFCSFLSIDTVNSVCETMKKSSIVSTAEVSNIISTQKKIELIRQEVQRVEILKIKQRLQDLREQRLQMKTLQAANKLQEHIREQHTQKSNIKSNLRFFTSKFTYKIKKKSKHQKIDVQKHSVVNSSLSINTVKSICESEKKSAIACSSSSQKSSIFSTTSRNLVTDTRISLQSISSKDSNFSIATLKITSERMKNASIQRIVCARTICKRCKQIFNFNNKFHEHIRQHHVRKFVISKDSDLRALASEFTYKTAKKSAIICSSASHASSTSSATSRSQIFSTKMSSRSVSSRDSHLTIATLKIISKSMKKLSINCSLTFSLSSSRNSIRKHHEFHMQKSYLIMNDLSRMFIEKSKSFDLRSHQDRSYSSQSFDIRQSSQSCFSIASKKFYLIIENLFEMFDEKFRKKNLFQNRNNVSFRAFSNQMRIIVYFKSAINQKLSISQNSKSSKSKSLNQHMSAKFIRTNFSKYSEKSIFLSYKMSDIFYIKSKIFLQSRFSSRFSFTWHSLTFSSSFRFSSSNLHFCCICFDQFNFNNWLHKHLRISYQNHSSCQSMRVLN